MPATSIIVPTYNGAHRIIGLINSLLSQSNKDFELIFVVDGSVDNTSEILEECSLRFSHFKIIEQTNLGRACSRNSGAEFASGEYLIFLDDDMRPHPELIEKHVEFLKSKPEAIHGGNQIEPLIQGEHDFLQFKACRRRKWNKQYGTNISKLKKENIYLTAANFSLLKTTFKQIGGFDSRLRDAEDFDLAVRAMELGVPIFFNPNAIAWHEDDALCLRTIKRMREYRKAHEFLCNLKPDLFNEYSKYKIQYPRGIKRNFFQFFASSRIVHRIDREQLKILPVQIRYHIYEYTLAALGNYFSNIDVDGA